MSRTFALFCMAILVTSCLELTKPRDIEKTTLRPPAPTPEVTVRPAPAIEPTPEAAPAEKIRVAHILVSFKGALNAGAKIARTKEDAKTLAGRVLNRAKFERFEDLARTYSEDATTKGSGGDLGLLTQEELADLGAPAFKLKPGGIDVVETDFGFHIIRRAL